MSLRERMSQRCFEHRFSYDPKRNMPFIDFRLLAIDNHRDIERIKAEVEMRVRRLGHAVYAIVNYGGCKIHRDVLASYHQMVAALQDSCCLGVTSYGLSRGLMPDQGGDRCSVSAANDTPAWQA